MSEEARKSRIITFKQKDQRPDKTADKLEIVSAGIKSKVRFFDFESATRDSAIISSLEPETLGYDVNRFEAPIAIAHLTDAEMETLKKDPNIASIEEDGPCYALGGINDSFVIEGQPSPLAETIPAGVSQIKAPAAWNCSRGKGIGVAVLDTGIDWTHPDLAANYKGGISFVPGESTAMDYNSHGTHCAGTIAAAINGTGVVGVAPTAYLYAVKILSKTGMGSWSYLIAGIDWCISRRRSIRVLSMSLGGSAAPTALQAMCNAAWNSGLLLVAAAGNSGPAMGTVEYPAKYGSVIAVSAIDSSNAIPDFSSRGPEVELCAPGVNVLSTIPGGSYGIKSGTSMACPHVSGAAALAWGSHRYANNVTIRRLLAWTADNLGIPGRDSRYGYGRVDAEQSAFELVPPPAIPGIP